MTAGPLGGDDRQNFTLGPDGWKKGNGRAEEKSTKGGSDVKYHRVDGVDEVGEGKGRERD
ncbi:hypothetical protein BU23DRAFT_549563 [Bimuria novae-zelandiae CBS 107.79]|uniref:Uncharacterized protein n=1 Tax=Bimuria novae-zelandiae CBS 107.79 TaxID=1447943 RepID=A0A6A5VVF5_9PLEO|nr:hypothetical protein BU23DRAFT_549563 [Bimuria novae-zelandiae CBS 107.79]